MFGFFSRKKPARDESLDGLVDAMAPDAPPHVQVLHLILEQAMTDKATEVLMQFDESRGEFAVYFQRAEQGYEEVLAPPPSLWRPLQTMLAIAANLRLPEDEGQFLLPRESGGRMRYSIAVEDGGATMALAPLGYL
jgi:hypothetical protein